jgi:uncharacterized protein YkwD
MALRYEVALVACVYVMAKCSVGEVPSGPIPISHGAVVIPLTDEQKLTAMQLHNHYRLMQGASDMQELRWSDRLADIAQNWTQRCFFFNPDSTWFPGYDDDANNDNLYLCTGAFNVSVAMAKWYGQIAAYNYTTNKCSKRTCAAYTQVVWSESYLVGCALIFCNSTVHDFTKDGVPVYTNQTHLFECVYSPA